MKAWEEFKKFAFKGNVVDMAVGVIVGGAFGKIVTSLVNDVIMPPVAALLGGVNFSALAVTLRAATEEAEAITLNYGAFIQTVVDFFLVALSVFFFVKLLAKSRDKFEKKQPEAPQEPPKPTKQEELLTEIRDLLKASNR